LWYTTKGGAGSPAASRRRSPSEGPATERGRQRGRGPDRDGATPRGNAAYGGCPPSPAGRSYRRWYAGRDPDTELSSGRSTLQRSASSAFRVDSPRNIMACSMRKSRRVRRRLRSAPLISCLPSSIPPRSSSAHSRRLCYGISVVEAVDGTVLKPPPLFSSPVDFELLNQRLQSFTAWMGVGVEAGDGLVVIKGA
jgi:hypothetical protein